MIALLYATTTCKVLSTLLNPVSKAHKHQTNLNCHRACVHLLVLSKCLQFQTHHAAMALAHVSQNYGRSFTHKWINDHTLSREFSAAISAAIGSAANAHASSLLIAGPAMSSTQLVGLVLAPGKLGWKQHSRYVHVDNSCQCSIPGLCLSLHLEH